MLPVVTIAVTQNVYVMAQNVKQEEPQFTFSHYGETTFKLNVRENPNMKAEILDILPFFEPVTYAEYNDEWVAIEYDNEVAYLKKEFIEELEIKSSFHVINDERKSYMDYRKITSKTSRQYKVQKRAYTTEEGYRMVGNRYCIALGSYYTTSVGSYVDLVLQNGEIIPCLLAECKADDNTVENHSKGADGSVSEFVVDENKIRSHDTEETGNCGKITKGWDSPVVKIIIYNKSIF